jgi:hypothetical protein
MEERGDPFLMFFLEEACVSPYPRHLTLSYSRQTILFSFAVSYERYQPTERPERCALNEFQ